MGTAAALTGGAGLGIRTIGAGFTAESTSGRLATISWIAEFLNSAPFYALLIKHRYTGHLCQDEEGEWKIDPD